MLLEEQAVFCQALLNADLPVPDFARDPNGAPAPKRFAVYRNNVVVSLVEALGAAYPGVKSMVGDEFFDALARTYVVQAPPVSPLMIYYGAGFAEFLAAFPPAQQLPFLPDLARLERLWLTSYHAEDAGALSASDLESVAAEQIDDLCLKPHPACQFLNSDFPVLDLFRVSREGMPSGQLDLSMRQSVMVSRPQFEVSIHQCGPAAVKVIEALDGHTSLAECVELLSEKDQAEEFSAILGAGLQLGWFLGSVTYKEQESAQGDKR